ncbi:MULTISPECIES: L,D-transpeptidase [Ochrobactrum]|jgi:lipoprotein-anchoring transpeptidase ErfK/SrfK|uniref:L,D-transpeptidase n=1 Tax=Ochrobactrum quorumnocens TaxID=271865 RepID=A0A248UL05_9HYPH|nr:MULTISPECIES: L,D-transpeptidase [Brucella/Ochrobactrum group]MBD7992269.1 L,D-transpeptidase [Ochrobactrum gallinarum]ASV87296.1 L,D-transpeptidase catalytic domain protein [[Ochrobactrum] quorumnocens]KAA9366826.1 L,D-transpeptidase [[Ochrobactrum] quorumnocens]MCV9906426.1 L,D-transpeptidase [Brucella sp. HL-2]MDH7789981.1 lipoprotein-anchoring transpeptidase ErfK/SrfK [Ochrobactrum sp. AN78]
MNSRVLRLSAALLLGGVLAGCSTVGGTFYTASYSAVSDAGYTIPAIPNEKIPQQYRRQIVKYQTDEAPGTIIVETREKFLYYVMPDGKAMRYGIGVGREGFGWSGTARVAMKREWPTWTPPAPMIKRQPELAKYRNGMGPGLKNPLGARALYLYNKGGDTGYRIHGTPEWWSIGKAMSSGCVRMMNQDIIDLHERAEQGAKVIVRQ